MRGYITYKDYLYNIKRRKKLIFWITFILTVIAIGVSLILPVKYTATASILPPSLTKMGTSSLSFPSGISSSQTASIFEMGPSPSDIFAKILQSISIRKRIVNRYNLMKYFKTKYLIDALKALESATNIKVSQEEIVEISVTLRDKKLAADIANAYVEELDKFNKETKMTQGKKYRIFVGKRLEDEKKTLKQVIQTLKEYQKKHRTIGVEELKKIINVHADLKSNLIEKEIQKNAYEKISPTNPYTQYLENEISGTRREIDKLESGESSLGWGAGFGTPFNQIPDVYAKLTNLLNDVEMHRTIYNFLIQQYEQAKIEEAKDTPTVQFLDRATPPEKKSFPKRKKIVIATFIFSFIFSLVIAFLFEGLERIKKED